MATHHFTLDVGNCTVDAVIQHLESLQKPTSSVCSLLSDVSTSQIVQECKNALLWWASYKDNVAVCKYLCANGADPTWKLAGKTALHCASARGFLQVIDVLLKSKNVPVDIKDDHGLTPLFWTVIANEVDCIEWLISNNASYQRCSSWKQTNDVVSAYVTELQRGKHSRTENVLTLFWNELAKGDKRNLALEKSEEQFWMNDLLCWAAGSSKDVEACKKLIEKGANPNCITWIGSPLHHAANCGNAEIVQYLLDSDVPVDKKDQVGRTPLWFAAKRGASICVKLLLERGANPCHRTPEGSPIEAGQKGSQVAVTKLMEAYAGKFEASEKSETCCQICKENNQTIKLHLIELQSHVLRLEKELQHVKAESLRRDDPRTVQAGQNAIFGNNVTCYITHNDHERRHQDNT